MIDIVHLSEAVDAYAMASAEVKAMAESFVGAATMAVLQAHLALMHDAARRASGLQP